MSRQIKTQGLVLGYIKYKESSIITRIYTEQLGAQSYIVNGIRSAKSRSSLALFQPLSLLDMEVYHKENQGLHRIKEYKTAIPYLSIPYDHHKTCIALFLAEVLGKVLREEEGNASLFAYLKAYVGHLDKEPLNMSSHLHFLLHLSGYLGFQVSSSMDLLSEIGLIAEGLHGDIEQLIQAESPQMSSISNQHRREILQIILKFYALHFEGFHELRSLKVLTEILRT